MMRSGVEFGVFLGVALAVHISFWWAVPEGDPGGAGDGGASAVTLAAISPTIEAMLESLDTPPEIAVEMGIAELNPQTVTEPVQPPAIEVMAPIPQTSAPSLVQPDLPQIDTAGLSLPQTLVPPKLEAPSLEVPVVPELDNTPPPVPVDTPQEIVQPDLQREAPQQPDTANPTQELALLVPPVPPKPTETPPQDVTADTPKPKQRPQPKPKSSAQQAQPQQRAAVSNAGQSAQRAKGTGQAQKAGAAQGENASLNPAKRKNLLQTWGNKVRARIERGKSYPRGTKASGTAMIRVTVTADGRLASIKLVRSSGDDILDQAAVNAAKRAGRFAKAPKALGPGDESFIIPIDMSQ